MKCSHIEPCRQGGFSPVALRGAGELECARCPFRRKRGLAERCPDFRRLFPGRPGVKKRSNHATVADVRCAGCWFDLSLVKRWPARRGRERKEPSPRPYLAVPARCGLRPRKTTHESGGAVVETRSSGALRAVNKSSLINRATWSGSNSEIQYVRMR